MTDARTEPTAVPTPATPRERGRVRLNIRVRVPFPAAYPLNQGLEHLADFPRSSS